MRRDSYVPEVCNNVIILYIWNGSYAILIDIKILRNVYMLRIYAQSFI